MAWIDGLLRVAPRKAHRFVEGGLDQAPHCLFSGTRTSFF